MTGVRVRLAVFDPPACPVAELAGAADARVDGVTWTRSGEADREDGNAKRNRGEGDVIEEVRSAADLEAAGEDAGVAIETAFAGNGHGVYQLSRDTDQCACEIVEALGCPVADVEADGDRLLMTLHLPSAEPLSGVIDALESAGASVDLRYLVRDGDGPDGGDPVVIDRGRLTDRQREVVRTAYRMGYFEYPRSAGAGEVAAALGVATSTFTEHLAAAQSKLLDAVVADDEGTPREPRG